MFTVLFHIRDIVCALCHNLAGFNCGSANEKITFAMRKNQTEFKMSQFKANRIYFLSSHNHIYIAKFFFSIRDDECKNLGHTTKLAREMLSSGCCPRLKNARSLAL